MRSPLLIAAGLLSFAAPVFAERPISVTSGALAGRSPHQAFVAADVDRTSCGKAMHSLPSGKPHTYGRHALGAQACEQPTLAAATPQTAAGAD